MNHPTIFLKLVIDMSTRIANMVERFSSSLDHQIVSSAPVDTKVNIVEVRAVVKMYLNTALEKKRE